MACAAWRHRRHEWIAGGVLLALECQRLASDWLLGGRMRKHLCLRADLSCASKIVCLYKQGVQSEQHDTKSLATYIQADGC